MAKHMRYLEYISRTQHYERCGTNLDSKTVDFLITSGLVAGDRGRLYITDSGVKFLDTVKRIKGK